jgi:hypothetical protein
MGTNRILDGNGTGRDFGIRATATSEPHKNPHSPDSPIWMPPGQIYYSQANADSAAAIKACADRVNENPLPNSSTCRISELADGQSFTLSVDRSNISIAANDSTSVTVSSTLLNAADSNRPITLTVTTPPGVNPGQYNPTTLQPGQSTWLGFWVPLGTPPTGDQTITITGDNGIDRSTVNVRVSTTACAPAAHPCGSVTCGFASDGCGGQVQCGAQCCTAQDVCSNTCGGTMSNGCGGTVKCPACPKCPKGQVWCPDEGGQYGCRSANLCW